MTQEHPLTPPLELIQKWSEQFEAGRSLYTMFEDIYRAGADAELEACLERILNTCDADALRAARRPKQPSLKEQALTEFDSLLGDSEHEGAAIILRALEQLPDNE
jgi:hypothetical protein